jgi:hypothetical protein
MSETNGFPKGIEPHTWSKLCALAERVADEGGVLTSIDIMHELGVSRRMADMLIDLLTEASQHNSDPEQHWHWVKTVQRRR